jgi:hypothetical protein
MCRTRSFTSQFSTTSIYNKFMVCYLVYTILWTYYNRHSIIDLFTLSFTYPVFFKKKSVISVLTQAFSMLTFIFHNYKLYIDDVRESSILILCNKFYGFYTNKWCVVLCIYDRDAFPCCAWRFWQSSKVTLK